ncbi:MAG: PhoH family protein [Clostridia bacterium]|nr:PhoH family protein [Clostridia bacterium]
MEKVTKNVKIDSAELTAKLFGSFDVNAKMIEAAFGVALKNRSSDGNSITVSGENAESVKAAVRAAESLIRLARSNEILTEQQVGYVISMIQDGNDEELFDLDDECICITTGGKPIKPKTVGQKRYVDMISKNTVSFGVGPAGTGKTFLAVAMAVRALRQKKVNRIILTLPAIEAGEKLGFLPGDLQSKIDPYLRPLYDALFEMMGAENYARLLEKGVIEIAPLAYMRGRTLDDSFIILDEAQNATPEQMKMFLTRLGFNSKAVITGDLTQTDLPSGQKSGLATAVKILGDIDDIGIHAFTERDVVRHKLVAKIILAYEKHERKESEQRSASQKKPKQNKTEIKK